MDKSDKSKDIVGPSPYEENQTVTYYTYDQLNEGYKVAEKEIEEFIKDYKEMAFSDDWKLQFMAITSLREINKYCADFFIGIIKEFLKFFISSLQNLRSNIVKNTLILLKETFSKNPHITRADSDYFLMIIPVVLERSVSEKSFLKVEAKEVLENLSKIPDQRTETLTVLSNYCNDKNSYISENSSEYLKECFKNINKEQFSKIDIKLVNPIIKNVYKLLAGKRALLKKNGEEIFNILDSRFGRKELEESLQKILTKEEVLNVMKIFEKKSKAKTNFQDFMKEKKANIKNPDDDGDLVLESKELKKELNKVEKLNEDEI